MLGSTVKQSSILMRHRLKNVFLNSTGILTCFPFNLHTFLKYSIPLLRVELGPTNPKRNTLV